MQEVDWTTFPKPSEEMQSRWLLQHSPKPKKKTVRKQTYAWTLAFIGIGVVIAFSMTIGALTQRHHYQQQAREAYNMALHTGLKFFNSRRCSERKGLVSVEVKNKKGQYDMKLLAVDIQMVSGPDKQLFLIGDEEGKKSVVRKKTLKENFKKVKESTVKRFKKLEKESS
ncbi:hypothetical protein HID58_063310 [Brassica napus]|uniref:Uncharacterized protein n=1 Tax=Brassica napus TaxID=3708 RepID=A0ABQ8A3Y3_BRANA|nr:hypothetical protein HID58_063310 [Brassica napus]